jgi:hypothetical protein
VGPGAGCSDRRIRRRVVRGGKPIHDAPGRRRAAC